MLYEILISALYVAAFACIFLAFDSSPMETVAGQARRICSLCAMFCLGIFWGGVWSILTALVVGYLIGDWRRGVQENKFYLFMIDNIVMPEAIVGKSDDSNRHGSPQTEANSSGSTSDNLVALDREDRQRYMQELRNAIKKRNKRISGN